MVWRSPSTTGLPACKQMIVERVNNYVMVLRNKWELEALQKVVDGKWKERIDHLAETKEKISGDVTRKL